MHHILLEARAILQRQDARTRGGRAEGRDPIRRPADRQRVRQPIRRRQRQDGRVRPFPLPRLRRRRDGRGRGAWPGSGGSGRYRWVPPWSAPRVRSARRSGRPAFGFGAVAGAVLLLVRRVRDPVLPVRSGRGGRMRYNPSRPAGLALTSLARRT